MTRNSISQIHPVLGKAATVDPKSIPPPPPPPPPPPTPTPTPTPVTNNYYISSTPEYSAGYMAPVTTEPAATVPTPKPPITEELPKTEAAMGLWGMDLGTTLTVAIAAAGLLYLIFKQQGINGYSARSKK